MMDLHLHSAWSADGEFPVAELVGRCRAAGLDHFAVTDHDTVRGVPEAARLAAEGGPGLIPGIEIDCNYCGTDLHLLGYGIRWESDDFAALEADIARKVTASFDAMIDNLRRLGFAADRDAVLAAAAGKLPTGELIAEVMIADARYHTPPLAPYLPGGARSDMPQINFYLDYCAQGRPAFVPVGYMPYAEAVELVRDNGGVPVVAHPGLNFRGRERVAEELLAHGAAGLEVFNNYHDAAQTGYFAALVVREGALMTCGSDFHGKTKPRIAVGQYASTAGYEERLGEFVKHVEVIGGRG